MSLSIPFAWEAKIQAARQRRSAWLSSPSTTTHAFDPSTAVMLGPFAFEVYNNPSAGTLSQQQAPELTCHYLSDDFLRELYEGTLQVRITSVSMDKHIGKDGE